jgi:hypothetical protein
MRECIKHKTHKIAVSAFLHGGCVTNLAKTNAESPKFKNLKNNFLQKKGIDA